VLRVLETAQVPYYGKSPISLRLFLHPHLASSFTPSVRLQNTTLVSTLKGGEKHQVLTASHGFVSSLLILILIDMLVMRIYRHLNPIDFVFGIPICRLSRLTASRSEDT
jgi:hypothetical protein